MSVKALPEGTLLYLQYSVSSEIGEGSIAFTLDEPETDTVAGRFARHAGATSYGLISILGLQGAPWLPIVWMRTDKGLAITVAEGEQRLSFPLQAVIQKYIAKFFEDIVSMTPAETDGGEAVASEGRRAEGSR